jgi:hypothetical protein
MSDSAILFLGPDMEGSPKIRRDTIHFETLDDAIVHAVEKLSNDRQYGAYIQSSDGNKIRMDEISKRYAERQSK